MQYLVVYQKADRKLIAAFKLNTFVTEMDVLVIPGTAYFLTLKQDIFHTAEDGTVYVKEKEGK